MPSMKEMTAPAGAETAIIMETITMEMQYTIP